MKNPFATEAFLAFSEKSRPSTTEEARILKVGTNGLATPVLIVKGRHPELATKAERFLITPICLSGPGGHLRKDLPEVSCSDSGLTDLAGGFMQTRMVYEGGSDFYTTESHFVHVDARTNYRLDTSLSASNLLKLMRRDSRSRARKILNRAEEFRLVSCRSEPRKFTQWFANSYGDLAEKKGFAESYRFCQEDWEALLEDPCWGLYVLLHHERPVAGAVVGDFESGSDYTFMTSVGTGADDYPRALILFLAERLKREGKMFLDLGGGISEGDALARFKHSMGGAPVPFARFRFVTRQLAAGRETMFKSVLARRWPL